MTSKYGNNKKVILEPLVTFVGARWCHSEGLKCMCVYFRETKIRKNNDKAMKIGLFQKYHNTLCLSSKILHKHCFYFPLRLL
mgnify:CR=1 FL=1